jgi:archaemetzincin
LIKAAGHTIVLAPVGDLPPALLQRICREITRIFGFQTRIEAVLADVSHAYDSNRDQYHSTAILDELAERIPPRSLKILAVVEVDLFIPILTHVYGEAQLGGKAGVISVFRLKQGIGGIGIDDTFTDRVAKEAIHELGHTFNLRHCKDQRCIMHYCRNEHDVDRKSDELCRYCRIMLADEVKRIGYVGKTNSQ